MKRKINKQLGFSMVELLVVILIIGIIAAIATVTYERSRIQSRDARRLADVREIFHALEIYYTNMEDYPPDCSDGGYSGGCDLSSEPVTGVDVDSSADGDFVSFLMPNFIGTVPTDPINDAEHNYFYATFVEYPAGSGVTYSYLIGSRLENEGNVENGLPPPAGFEDYYILGSKID
jgi:prepilin-type N-terminal cleavage/methylation domain-containing protein